FRRSEREVGRLLDTNLRIAADFDFLCRLCGGTAAFIDEIHYHRREHEYNVSLQRDRLMKEIQIVRARYRFHAGLRKLGPFAPTLAQDYPNLAYDCRAAGNYGAAAGWLVASLLIWGPRFQPLAALAKLLPHAAQSWLFRQAIVRGGS